MGAPCRPELFPPKAIRLVGSTEASEAAAIIVLNRDRPLVVVGQNRNPEISSVQLSIGIGTVDRSPASGRLFGEVF